MRYTLLLFSLAILNLPLFGDDAPPTPLGINPTASQMGPLPAGWSFLPQPASGILPPDLVKRLYPNFSPGKDEPVFSIFNGGGFTETLAATLAPNTTYTLTVGVGARTEGAWGGFDFKVDTISGAFVGDWIGGNRNFAQPGSIEDFARSFTTGPAPAGAGEKIRITISQPPGAGNAYTDVADIRLDVKPAAFSHTAGQPIDVMVVAGQSNAHGWKGDISKMNAEYRHYVDAPNPQAILAYRQRNLSDPLDNVGSFAIVSPQGPGFCGNFNGCGGELSLATDLADATKHPVAVIKYAIGSAELNGNFAKRAGQLYPPFISFVNTSLQQLRDQGFTPTLKAVFWLQGESDVGNHSNDYGDNITGFVQDLRKDWNAPDLKFFLTEINVNMHNLSEYPKQVALVNKGMTDLTQKDPLVFFIPTSDMKSDFGDDVHYSADQQIKIGQRWAKAYQDHEGASAGSPPLQAPSQ